MNRKGLPRPATASRARTLILLAVLLCLGLTATELSALAENVTCSACGKSIRGEYLTFEGGAYCSQDCLETVLPVCGFCNRAIRGSHLTLNGKNYCDRICLSRVLPACDICERPVEGNYYESKGKTFCCEACYHQSLPRCEACGERMNEWLEIEGRLYCHPCSNDRRCDACGHPGPSVELQDGRQICTECWKTAVVEQKDAEQLFQMVRKRMDRSLGLTTDHEIEFHLVSRDDMLQISDGASNGRELGYYKYQAETTTTYLTTRDNQGREGRRVAGERTDEKYRIYILYGLPEKRLMEVAAHELAHDWMRVNLPRIKTPIFEEGFAEYVAWLVNDRFGHEALKTRIENKTDPIYGGGFKMMQDLAQRHGGLDGLIDYLEDLP